MAADVIDSNVFQRHLDFLMTHMEPDYGLLDKLLADGVLSWIETIRIKAELTFFDRNLKILDFVSSKNKFIDLQEGLKVTNQMHLINYLKANGRYSSEYDDVWPLSDEDIRILEINHGCLIEMIETSELVSKMYSQEILNKRQRDTISSKQIPHESAEILLDILRRQSVKDFKSTIQCLHLTRQSPVAAVLEKGGVLMRIHANLQCCPETVAQKEEQLVSSITQVLSDLTLSDSARILELVHMRLVSVGIGQSVMLYFHCKTLSELTVLSQGMLSGYLCKCVETAFNQMLSTFEKIPVTIEWTDSDHERCLNYFKVQNLLTTKFSGFLDTPPNSFVYGVTKMRDKIFVLCQSPMSILIYMDKEPYHMISKMDFFEIGTPEDIAACDAWNCLFLTDSDNACVWKITMDHQIKKWLNFADDPWTLSVSNEGCVVMARNGPPRISESSWKGTSCVEIYEHDASLLRVFEMPKGARDILHAVMTDVGSLVVSFFSSDSNRWDICEFGRDGRVIHKFSAKSPSYRLVQPCHLALNSDSRVFVADSFRIILLGSSLEWERDILPDEDDDIENPERLCYDDMKKQLIVFHSGGIYIYSVFSLGSNLVK